MKKRAVTRRPAQTLEEMMTVRFKAVLDSVVRLREQWDREIRDLRRAHAADLRVTRLVERDHHRRIRSLEERAAK